MSGVKGIALAGSLPDRPAAADVRFCEMLDDAGAPTERYRRFRDESQSRLVLAEALRDAYADVFALNEDAHRLSPHELKGILARLTGKHEDVVEKMGTTFRAFAGRADFEAHDPASMSDSTEVVGESKATDVGEIHPLIMGLLRELPEPGSLFSKRKQADWLEIAQAAFRLIYRDDEDEATSLRRADEPESESTNGGSPERRGATAPD